MPPAGGAYHEVCAAAFPDAKPDEAKAEERAGHWAREWERRFDQEGPRNSAHDVSPPQTPS